MRVSAIFENSGYNYHFLNLPARVVNSRGLDFSSYNNESKIVDDSQNLYDSINEWKYFCNSQVAAGKLDIIV